MHINNVNAQTSRKNIVIFAIISAVITIGAVWTYIATTAVTPSITGFFSWYVMIFDKARDAFSGSEFWVPYMLMIVFPLCMYGTTILLAHSRNKALKKLERSTDLRSIDLLKYGVRFNYFYSQKDFVCLYQDISRIDLVFKSVLVHTKYSSYPQVNEVVIKFTLSNGNTQTISNTPISLMKLIYAVVDVSRPANCLEYRFIGAGEPDGIREKLEDYRKTGVKQLLSTPQENMCKVFSVLLFTFGLFMVISFKDAIADMPDDLGLFVMLFIPLFLPIIVSFILDILLIADKIIERNHNV